MAARPLSVTLIGWILIILGFIRLWGLVFILESVLANDPQNAQRFSIMPLPIPTQLFILLLGTGITLLAGIYVLGGAHWARMLWSIWCVLLFMLNLIIVPNRGLFTLGLLFEMLILFLLFMPKANAFFLQTSN